jgi:hypothetical protein
LPMPVLEPVTMAVLPSSLAVPLYFEQHTMLSTICQTLLVSAYGMRQVKALRSTPGALGPALSTIHS